MEEAALFAPVEAALFCARRSVVVKVHDRGIDHDSVGMLRVEISALSSFSCAETRNDVEDD